MKKVLFAISLFYFWGSLLLWPVLGEAKEELKDSQLHARCAVLMDAQSGRILYGKEENLALPMASTTKIMTCIVALEQADPDELVRVSAYAAKMPDVQLGIREGEAYLLKDLLHSLMLESHNDSAVAIAEHVGGTVEGFASLMNQKAKELGCMDTCFLTPNGLDATKTLSLEDGSTQTVTHSASAADMARILSYCILRSPKRSEFLEITRCPGYSFSNVETDAGGKGTKQGSRIFQCTNHNAFLNMMEGALTGKTGFTGNAGYCYVGALEHEGATYVIALLACGWPGHKTWKWEDARTLFSYGIRSFRREELVDPKLPIPKIRVLDAKSDSGFLAEQTWIRPKVAWKSYPVLLRETDQVEIEKKLPKILSAPVGKGEQIGSIVYKINGETVLTLAACNPAKIEKRDFPWYFRLAILRFWCGWGCYKNYS